MERPISKTLLICSLQKYPVFSIHHIIKATNVSNSISTSDLNEITISSEIVCKSLSCLKRGKKDGVSVYSNHLSLASVILAPYLSSLFTSMLQHEYIPSTLLDCVLKPLPKPGKDPRLSDSYRPIALASTLSKLFEWCILLQFNDAFISSDLQFGFKQGLSTDLCTGLIKNVIARYNSSGSHVLGCFLDASKAFDRVNHYVLFKKTAG